MSAQEKHSQAEQAREQGRFLDALKLTDEALVLYQEENNLSGVAEIFASRSITLRHLFDKSGEKAYLVLAKHEMMAAVEISPGVMPLYNLAKVEETLGELLEAIENYKKAISEFLKNPPPQHNRPGVLLDIKINLAIAEFRNGDNQAETRIVDLLNELEKTEEPKYNKDVWVSGGYMKLAEITKNKDYLQKAKEIIDANPELSLRKIQWQKLSESFS
jgi:tetratricopeptide (TPR) repeat protein